MIKFRQEIEERILVWIQCMNISILQNGINVKHICNFISDYNDGTREAWYSIHYNMPEANIALFKQYTQSYTVYGSTFIS